MDADDYKRLSWESIDTARASGLPSDGERRRKSAAEYATTRRRQGSWLLWAVDAKTAGLSGLRASTTSTTETPHARLPK